MLSLNTFFKVCQKISNMVPGTILQMHPDCAVFLDPPAAALLSR